MNDTLSRGLELIEEPRQVEASLWRRLRFEACARCRERLFERHLDLARAIARGEFRRRPAYGLERADFEQLAYTGLLEAIDRFDPLRGAPFEAFARHRIRGAIADSLLRSSERGAQFAHQRRVELERVRSLRAEESSGDFIGDLVDLASGLAVALIAEQAARAHSEADNDAYQSLAWREAQMNILNEIERLSDAERTVLRQHYFHGLQFNQIAALMRLSKGRVSQLHRAGLLRIRQRLTKDRS